MSAYDQVGTPRPWCSTSRDLDYMNSGGIGLLVTCW
jgi:hypothetical protein